MSRRLSGRTRRCEGRPLCSATRCCGTPSPRRTQSCATGFSPLTPFRPRALPGALSDASFSRYRRRVFIVASAVLVIVSTLFVAYAKELATLLSSLSGLGDWDPEQEEQIQSIAIAIGVVGFYTLDFGLNGLQATLRVCSTYALLPLNRVTNRSLTPLRRL